MSYAQTIRPLVGHQLLMLPGIRAIILNEKKEILFQFRIDKKQWALPCGAVEPDEFVSDAVRREMKEELSINVLDIEPMGLYTGPEQRFTYSHGDQVQCFALAVIISKWNGEPTPDNEEACKIEFFSPLNLPDNIFAIHQETLKDYRFHYEGPFLLR